MVERPEQEPEILKLFRRHGGERFLERRRHT